MSIGAVAETCSRCAHNARVAATPFCTDCLARAWHAEAEAYNKTMIRAKELEAALRKLAGRDTFGVNPDGTYIKSQQWARDQLAAILAGGVR